MTDQTKGKVRLARLIITFMTSLALILSFLALGNNFRSAAAPGDTVYTANIRFRDSGGQPKVPQNPGLSGSYYVMVTSPAPSDAGTTDPIWAIKYVNIWSSSDVSAVFTASDFRMDNKPEGTGSNNNGGEGWFDSEKGCRADTLRLWYSEADLSNLDSMSYAQVSALLEDKRPYGFKYSGTDAAAGEINLTEELEALRFSARIAFNGSAKPITAEDRIYVLVKLDHQTTQPSYYLENVTVDGGVSGSYTWMRDIREGDWCDGNGNKQPNERFTGNETGVSITLVKATKDTLSYNDVVYGNNRTILGIGDDVHSYRIAGYSGRQQDEAEPAPECSTPGSLPAITTSLPFSEMRYPTV